MNEHPTAISTSSISTGEGILSGGEASLALSQLSDEEFWQYARELAYKTPTSSQPEEHVECLLSRDRCLIPIAALYEVIPPPHRFALLPAMPPWMVGVVAWRGETIAVIDLEAYLFGSTNHLLHEGTLLVASHAGLPLGLVVPSIGETTAFEDESTIDKGAMNCAPTEALPERVSRFGGSHCALKGVQGDVLLLDIAALLTDVIQRIEIAASDG